MYSQAAGAATLARFILGSDVRLPAVTVLCISLRLTYAVHHFNLQCVHVLKPAIDSTQYPFMFVADSAK